MQTHEPTGVIQATTFPSESMEASLMQTATLLFSEMELKWSNMGTCRV